MDGILFNYIPGSGVTAPGTFFEVNSGGSYASNSKAVLFGHCASAGALAAATPTVCTTLEDAARLCGVGSQLYEMYRVFRENAPVLPEVWLNKVAISGTAGAWTITIGTLQTAAGDGVLEIAGRSIRYAKPASETAANTATGLAAAINAFVDPVTLAYLPVTATAATNVVTLTARHAGTTLNELEVAVDETLPGNIFTAALMVVAQSVTATGTASVADALAALGEDQPFDWLVSPFGDATNVGLAETALSDDGSGRWAWNQQLYGHYFSVSTDSIANHTTFGGARNSRHASTLARAASPTPSWEWIAGYVGRQSVWLMDDTLGNASRNMSALPIQSVRPPRARANWYSYATRNTLLNAGMSTWSVNASGQVCVDKCVTHMRLNNQGQPDASFRDVQAIAQVTHGLRYMRAGLSYRLANRAIAGANPANLGALVTPEDIKVVVLALHGDLVDRGLFEDKASFARALVVARNVSNPARVDIGMKIDRANPLDILAVHTTIYAQYPRAA